MPTLAPGAQVREVRDAARETVTLLDMLRAYSTNSNAAAAGGWEAYARAAMAAKGAACVHSTLEGVRKRRAQWI